ncbi:hypothetical protein Ddye_021039 [Dipteronia dyeriana]|uniref:Uncharacterized protein n=1 Tax=Dipteronia dyeriana TaxID=168575 RepID=A0AAD9U1Y0_9ROSI|nr:hypothetical protein Ddye_021039 [Dipteronia dyeriana]
MDSQSQTTSLQRLQNVEKVILISKSVFVLKYLRKKLKSSVRVLELAGGVMDELANPTGLRKEVISNHCREFIQKIKARLIFCGASYCRGMI